MDIPCLSMEVYHVYQHSIYMVYPWIYMVHQLMDIHGISMVYPWIFLNIPRFLKPNFPACLCCWSHWMRTRVWVIKSVLFHAPPWQLCHGDRLHERLNQPAANLPSLSLAVAVTAAAVAVSRESFSFPSSLVAGNNLNLGERWSQWCLQSNCPMCQGSLWPCGQGGGLVVVRSPVRTLPPREYGGTLMVWPGMLFPNLDGRIHQSLVFLVVKQLRCLPALKIKKELNFYLQRR